MPSCLAHSAHYDFWNPFKRSIAGWLNAFVEVVPHGNWSSICTTGAPQAYDLEDSICTCLLETKRTTTTVPKAR